MILGALLEELRSRDVQIWAEGDQLRCNAPAGALTPVLRDQLRQRKPDLVEFLRAAAALAQQERAIVPLQPRGGQVPVFGVAGHNGDVFCYRVLAQQLGEDQPFFGLQPPGLDGHRPPLTSVADLAGYFAEQICAFRPDGPYVVAGYCAGGAIAFELGRQLLQQGADLRFVAMFASPYPAWFRGLPQFRERVTRHLQRAKPQADSLAPSSKSGSRYLTELLQRWRARRESRAQASADPVLVRRSVVESTTLAAVRRYKPRYLEGRLCLFLPGRDWLSPGYATELWRPLARDIEEYNGPDGGDRDVLLREPYVSAIAALFRRCRDEKGERERPT